MLKKRLSSYSTCTRSGVAIRSPCAAGRRFCTYGRATCTNGRIWFWMIGAASCTNGSTWWLVVSSWRKAGRSELSELARRSEYGPSFVSVLRVTDSVAGSFDTAAEMFWFSCANADRTVLDEFTSRWIWPSVSASVFVRSP